MATAMAIWPGQSSERPSGALDSAASSQAPTAVITASTPVTQRPLEGGVFDDPAGHQRGDRGAGDRAAVQEASPLARSAGVRVLAMIIDREAGKSAAAPMPEIA
ncbi:hypothetical protein SALBM311S_12069 [Streptomyces alboniger]